MHDDPAAGSFLLDDFDFFGGSAGPSDEEFARLLLLGDDAAAGDAATKPAGRPQRSDLGAKPLTPARRRTASPPSTPEKSDGKATQARRTACNLPTGRRSPGRASSYLDAACALTRLAPRYTEV